MSVREKWLIVGILIAVVLGFFSHHYWAWAVDVLQRLVAVGFAGASAIIAAA